MSDLKNRSGVRRKKRRFYGNKYIKLNIAESPNVDCDTSACPSPALDEDNSAECSKSLSGSFNWRPYLRKPGFLAAPVSCFKHVAFSNCWDSIVFNVRIEVRSPDCKTCCTGAPCSYWLATVIKVCGYWGLLRYDGFDKSSPHYWNVPDKWVNLCNEAHIHPIGWCAANGKPLVPPKCLEDKISDWKEFLVSILVHGRTIPSDFTFKIEEHTLNSIKKSMKLEVVDKNLISVVRSAVVTDVVGGRLHIKYAESENEDEGFWCHERSPLIHPVGWAQIIGHALKARPEYARQSLRKTLYRTFSSNDATWDMFLPVYNPAGKSQFKAGMKLEAIDPLNLSTICVATVTEVLRNNYLMIGIDGMMAANGADCFCYHASSPCIFPVGFCESKNIPLTPPRGYKGEFKWSEYLKKTKAESAPVSLFRTDVPDIGFKEGMYLEAVDLMEPRLICVAYVTKVVGRLLKVHFEGWEDDYDQWCDFESPDLFPIGWCDALGYRLEPPRIDGSEDIKKKKKTIIKKKKRKHLVKKSVNNDDSPNASQEAEPSKSNVINSKETPQAIPTITIDESSSGSLPGKKKNFSKKLPSKSPQSAQKEKPKVTKEKNLETSSPLKSAKSKLSPKASPKPLIEKKNRRAKKLIFEDSPKSEKTIRRRPVRQSAKKKIISEDVISFSDESNSSDVNVLEF